MFMAVSCLHSIKYVLGEVEGKYNDVEVFQHVLTENSFPNLPDLFGWGGYCRSSKTVFEMAYESMKLTLQASSVNAADIELVIICSSDFNPGQETQSYRELLLSLGLTSAFPMGVTVSDCANLLSALNMAKHLIAAKQFRHIMLVTSNKISDEKYRFQDYALFSDGAASFIVSDKDEQLSISEGCFDIIDSQIGARFEHRNEGEDIDDTPLYIASAKQMVERTNVVISDITKVFSNNLYLPVITLKEGSVGITKAQLYLDNVTLFGHCFSADSVINLSDYMASTAIKKGEYFALHSSAEGLRAQVLLQACLDSEEGV